jgi:hypothetical protein
MNALETVNVSNSRSITRFAKSVRMPTYLVGMVISDFRNLSDITGIYNNITVSSLICGVPWTSEHNPHPNISPPPRVQLSPPYSLDHFRRLSLENAIFQLQANPCAITFRLENSVCTAETLESSNTPPPPPWKHSYPLPTTIFYNICSFHCAAFLPLKNDIEYGRWPKDLPHVNEAFVKLFVGNSLTSPHILFLDSNLGYTSRISRFSLCTEDWQKRDHIFWRLLRCTISITETRYLYIYCIPIELVPITKIGKSYT